MSSISELDDFTSRDIYSILMYAIYSCTKDPEYATLSELIYTINEKDLLKLCAIFGGTTIKIPTLNELKLYLKALMICNDVLHGTDFDVAYNKAELNNSQKAEVLKIYNILSKVIQSYGNNN